MVTLGVVFVWLAAADCLAGDQPDEPAQKFFAEQIEFFEKQVRPLLSEHCYSCHSADARKLQAGLLVDSRTSLLAGGDSGPSIVPGDPEASLLMEAVRWESYEMPPKGKLSDREIATLEEWIQQGAAWPVEAAAATEAIRSGFDLQQRAAEHWVWQPVANPVTPVVRQADWPTSDLDHFVLQKLEEHELSPATDADRSAVLRRLYFDLIGLPPSVSETVDFLADDRPDAIDRVVDRLLDSEHFGERWGRHWLDLVRYAESRGHEFDNDAPNAFQYRDYIVRAFNADVPYDQLVREHIAGDLLARPRLHSEQQFNESVLGTGFWFLGEWVHSPVDIRKDESDRFDNMIDVMSKTFLGVTVSCARCHDHKFDAISTADYYSLTGFLQSSDYRQVRFESMEQNRRVARKLARVEQRYRDRVQRLLAEHELHPPATAPLQDAVTDRLVLNYQTAQEDWLQDGFVFGSGPQHSGVAWLDTSGEAPEVRFRRQGVAANDLFWNGLKATGQPIAQDRSALSKLPRSGRTLRTPTFELTNEVVGCRVRGKGHVVACVDSHRLVAGPLHKQTIKKINAGDVVLDLARYTGHRIHLEFTPAEGAQLEVAWIVQGTKQEVKRALASATEGDKRKWRKFSAGVRRRLGAQLKELASQWATDRSRLQSQVVRVSQTAMAMMDGTGEDARILIRGNSSKPGEIVPRSFLTAIAGRDPLPIARGSGRLDLAERINDPTNPLTSRVIVNRIWHHLMGRGIVATTDDFGVLGQRPTHPALLDHLAAKFLADGRSIKRMIRYIVLSRTYQMSGRPDPSAVESDPTNQFWHHRPPVRLQGEAVRDALLAVSGNLNSEQFGPSVPIHLTGFMDGRGRPKSSGPLDGDGRRSIYVAVRRNFLSPFMMAFDFPVPFSTMGRRNVSNVPSQALILMNDPFVADQAAGWASRALRQENETDQRIEWMYLSAFARRPTDLELDLANQFLGNDTSPDRWADFAHALINTKEFIFLK